MMLKKKQQWIEHTITDWHLQAMCNNINTPNPQIEQTTITKYNIINSRTSWHIRKSVTRTSMYSHHSKQICFATFFSPKFSESKSKFLQSSPTVKRDRNSVGLLNVQSALTWRSICIFATTPVSNTIQHNNVDTMCMEVSDITANSTMIPLHKNQRYHSVTILKWYFTIITHLQSSYNGHIMSKDSRKSPKYGNHGNCDFRQMPWFCQNTVFAVFLAKMPCFSRFFAILFCF